MKNWVLTALALLWFSVTAPVQAADAIFIQSTTSTQNSGLLDALLPIFTQDTGIAVRVVAVGTGQAIKNAKNGDGDVLLVHSKDDEEVFVKAGWGLERLDVMYNDFVIIGPRLDPAGIRASADVSVALQKIAALQVPFLSRGDDSGTHKAEKKLWTATGIDVAAASGSWYREAGLGMGATLYRPPRYPPGRPLHCLERPTGTAARPRARTRPLVPRPGPARQSRQQGAGRRPPGRAAATSHRAWW